MERHELGKSTYLQATFPNSLTFDLLQTDVWLDLAKRPALLREQILAAPARELQKPITIDEVQKVPQGRTNLLGGRAWRFEMHPWYQPRFLTWTFSARSTGAWCRLTFWPLSIAGRSMHMCATT